MDVSNNTNQPISATETRLEPTEIASSTQAAAEAFIAAGTAANTVRSYRSALAYWDAWLHLRYNQALGDGALPAPVVVQFIVDHLARPTPDGAWHHLLPLNIDSALCQAGSKASPAFGLQHRQLSFGRLGQVAQTQAMGQPLCRTRVSALLRDAGKAQVRQGIRICKKTALTRELLQALLATCTDGLRFLRDKALLLLAWSGGGRRRSEVVA